MKDDELVMLMKSTIKGGSPLFDKGDKQGCHRTHLKVAQDGRNLYITSKKAQDFLCQALKESEQVLARD